MPIHTTCDGVRRRDFLKVGVAGGAGLTLASYMQMAHAGQVAKGKAESAIFINLNGGPTHMDTFDLKPDAPEEYRGEFSPIKTNVAGIEISEHLPLLAQTMDKFCLLRGVTHTLGAHQLGTEYVNTGNRPLPSLEFPGYGAVVTKERPGDPELPGLVAVGRQSRQRPGFLGVKYAPLNTGATPVIGQKFSVRGMTVGGGLTLTDVEKRQRLLAGLDKTFRDADNSQLLDGLDRFSQQAHTMITSNKTRTAFDISQESPAFTKQFGESQFGASCLLATRLVESGVRFVTLSNGGWDTHRDNWTRLKTKLLPELDSALSGLFSGLAEKGLLEKTVVYVTGEFGRTPKINKERVGRDHYPRNMFMLLAGGGVKGGQALGKSDEKGTFPVDGGYSPDDVAASFYHALGIDHTMEYHSNTGRPIMVVRDGNVIPEVFG